MYCQRNNNAIAVQSLPLSNTKRTTMKSTLIIEPIKLAKIEFTVRGTSPLIMHAWSEKALKMMRMTATERRKQKKTERNPEEEAFAATYKTEDGQYGVPAMALKSSLIGAAHKDTGLAKTDVRKALRFPHAGILPIECCEPTIREDIVRVGMGATDIRYRCEFQEWSCRISFNFDTSILTANDILNLVDRAGFAVGVGEWRPEKGGEFGCFEVDRSEPIEQSEPEAK